MVCCAGSRSRWRVKLRSSKGAGMDSGTASSAKPFGTHFDRPDEPRLEPSPSATRSIASADESRPLREKARPRRKSVRDARSAPGGVRTPDPLLRSRVTTLIKTCRSERKAEHNQQVVTNADQLLAPSLSPLSSRFATACHNYYYVFMTAASRS